MPGRPASGGRDPHQDEPEPASGDPELTPGAVARRLGVAVPTLRSWDRRYGLGASRISEGGHRRYSADDLVRLEAMCALVADGVPAAEAARAVGAGAEPPRRDTPGSARRGGGETLRVGGRAGQGLARAAMRLDADTVEDILQRTFAAEGVVAGWENLARPVLYGMGRKWESGQSRDVADRYVEVEHLLSHCVSTALRRLAPPPPRPARPRGRGVLLACAESELHTLPLEALAAALRERGLQVRMFGAALPRSALLRAVRRTGPAAVVVWSQTGETGQPDLLADLATRTGPRPGTVFAAGPGWANTTLPSGISRVNTLTDAVAAVTALPPLRASAG